MDGFLVSPVPQARGIRAEGEIDIAAIPELKPALDDAASAGGPVFVDLRGVTFIGCLGPPCLPLHR